MLTGVNERESWKTAFEDSISSYFELLKLFGKYGQTPIYSHLRGKWRWPLGVCQYLAWGLVEWNRFYVQYLTDCNIGTLITGPLIRGGGLIERRDCRIHNSVKFLKFINFGGKFIEWWWLILILYSSVC